MFSLTLKKSAAADSQNGFFYPRQQLQEIYFMNINCQKSYVMFFFSPKQEAPKYPSYDSTTLINSAFPERDTSPVRKLVEDLVLQEPMAEEPDEASGSDVYLSSTEDTAEFEKIRLPLESVTVSCQTAQFSELEWDAAGCGLEVESFDGAEIEELVACAVEGVNSCDGFKRIGCSHIFFYVRWEGSTPTSTPLCSQSRHSLISFTFLAMGDDKREDKGAFEECFIFQHKSSLANFFSNCLCRNEKKKTKSLSIEANARTHG